MSAACPPFDADCERIAQITAFKWRGALDYEDAVQDARIGVWLANRTWRESEPASLWNWRYSKAKHEIIDGYRRRHSEMRNKGARDGLPQYQKGCSLDQLAQCDDPEGQSLGDAIPWAEPGFDRVDIDLLIRDLLGERETAIIRASFFEGILCREIGVTMGITESRVVQIRKNALAVLRDAITEGGYLNTCYVVRTPKDYPVVPARRSA